MIPTKKDPETKLQSGERVKHEKFGEGVVHKLSRSSNGQHIHVDVEFDEPFQYKSSPPTRFRKIMAVYLLGLGVPEPLDGENDTIDMGLMNILGDKIDSITTGAEEEYSPTGEDKKAASESDTDGELNIS
jgi:hypothetical protein